MSVSAFLSDTPFRLFCLIEPSPPKQKTKKLDPLTQVIHKPLIKVCSPRLRKFIRKVQQHRSLAPK